MKKGISTIPDIAEIGSFFAGGRKVTLTGRPKREMQVARNGPPRMLDMNGDYVTGQCYVHYVRHAKPRFDAPVMFWHGGAMTGATWETTPDARPGWQMYFLKAGFDTYLCDAVERGRSGWSPYPEIYDSAPVFRTANEAWEVFRFGQVKGYPDDSGICHPHQGLQFPVEYLDRFAAQFVPRWINNDKATLDAYFDALEKTGPVWLIAHSQGGDFALEAAARHPGFFRGLIVIEPASTPDAIGDAHKVPHLFVWGDYIGESEIWKSYRSRADAYAEKLSAAGGEVEIADLPRLGISGNSHVPMMDRNSDKVAEIIEKWIRGKPA